MSDNNEELLTGTKLAMEYDITSGRISQIINKLGLSDKLIKQGNKKLIPKDVESEIRKQLDSSVEDRNKSTDSSLIVINKELRERIEELKQDKRELRADLEKATNTANALNSIAQSNIALSEKLKAIEAPKDITNDDSSIVDELKRVIEEQNSVVKEETSSRIDKLKEELEQQKSDKKGFFKKLFGN